MKRAYGLNSKLKQKTAKVGRKELQVGGEDTFSVASASANFSRPGRTRHPEKWAPGGSGCVKTAEQVV
jgi:hypothetical protein